MRFYLVRCWFIPRGILHASAWRHSAGQSSKGLIYFTSSKWVLVTAIGHSPVHSPRCKRLAFKLRETSVYIQYQSASQWKHNPIQSTWCSDAVTSIWTKRMSSVRRLNSSTQKPITFHAKARGSSLNEGTVLFWLVDLSSILIILCKVTNRISSALNSTLKTMKLLSLRRSGVRDLLSEGSISEITHFHFDYWH